MMLDPTSGAKPAFLTSRLFMNSVTLDLKAFKQESAHNLIKLEVRKGACPRI
jgi:hypothetical protein